MHCSSENKIHKPANQNVQLTELELFVSYIVLNFITLPAGFLSIYSLDLYIKQKKKLITEKGLPIGILRLEVFHN